MDRRRFVIGTAATALAAGPALAQETYPSRPITIINAFPPGGLNDIVTRPLAMLADPQAAGPGRDQGRRRRTDRRAGRRLRQARRIHPAVAQHRHLRLRRGRQAVRPCAQDHPRRLHCDRAPDRGSGPAAGQ